MSISIGGGMARRAKKMIDLKVEETSGVDHPAHLKEGWMVMKSADAELLDILDPQTETEEQAEATAEKEDTLSDVIENSAEVVEETPAEDLTKSLEEAKARIQELEAELEKAMKPKKKKMMGDMEDDEEDEAVRMKKEAPAPLRKMLEDLEKSAEEAKARAEAAEAVLIKEREDRLDQEAIAKAKDTFNHLPVDADKIGPALRRLADLDSELAKSVEDVLTAVNAQAESADIFAELGKSAGQSAGASALDTLTSLAKSAVDNGTAASFEQAFSDAIVANPSLYSQYLAEKGA